jgi:hypothetical protein
MFVDFAPGEELSADDLNTRFPRGIMTAPTTSMANGTATAADTVEVRDAVLGNYVFTALANRRYRAWYTGGINSATIDTQYIQRIRDGGASTPTAASTLIAESNEHIAEASTGGIKTVLIGQTFTATAGVHTLSLFSQSPNSAVLTPVPRGTPRELYVEDIGPA